MDTCGGIQAMTDITKEALDQLAAVEWFRAVGRPVEEANMDAALLEHFAFVSGAIANIEVS